MEIAAQRLPWLGWPPPEPFHCLVGAWDLFSRAADHRTIAGEACRSKSLELRSDLVLLN
jgi:hypothetical protein